MVDEARGDLDDVAAAPLLHLGDGELRDVEEAGEVDADDGGEIGLGVAGEGPGDEVDGIVDERVDTPEPRHAFRDRAVRLDQGPADALRRTGDDGDFPSGIHGTFLHASEVLESTPAAPSGRASNVVVVMPRVSPRSRVQKSE